MGKLVCVKCGHEDAVPMHCGQEMHQEGDELVCWMGKGCGYQAMPDHCEETMKITE